ncbi:MAG TPA: hypothetical protein VM367_14435 [Pseudonocardia sp.]|nr:hypothetical protein [Pseudonocardia sp.]
MSHVLAVGLGYTLGRPDGPRRLGELLHRPEVRRLRKRGRDLAGDGAQALKRRVGERAGRRGRKADAAGDGADDVTAGPGARDAAQADTGTGGLAPAAGFAGSTPVDDTQAVITGLPAPPRAAQPSPPGEDR